MPSVKVFTNVTMIVYFRYKALRNVTHVPAVYVATRTRHNVTLRRAFAKTRKETVTFVISACPHVFDTPGRIVAKYDTGDFYEKSVQEGQKKKNWLKYDKNYRALYMKTNSTKYFAARKQCCVSTAKNPLTTGRSPIQGQAMVSHYVTLYALRSFCSLCRHFLPRQRLLPSYYTCNHWTGGWEDTRIRLNVFDKINFCAHTLLTALTELS